jgi:hypothetical protein
LEKNSKTKVEKVFFQKKEKKSLNRVQIFFSSNGGKKIRNFTLISKWGNIARSYKMLSNEKSGFWP